MNTTYVFNKKIRPEKILDEYRIWTYDFCSTPAVFYQLS